MIEFPLTILAMFTISSTLLLAYLLRIVEYGIAVDANDNGKNATDEFLYLGDALWYIFITFATVGYGDYYPKTNIGRIIGVFTAIVGTTLMSLVVVTLRDHFTLAKIETNVVHFVDRVIYKDDIKAEAASYINLYIKYTLTKRDIVRELEKLHPNMSVVKKKQNELRQVIYKRIDYKKHFKRFIQ